MQKPKATIKINDHKTVIGVIIAPSTAARIYQELTGKIGRNAHYFKCHDTWKVKDNEIDMITFGAEARQVIYKNGDVVTDRYDESKIVDGKSELEYNII